VIEVEPDEYLSKEFSYPVFTQLKGPALYAHAITGHYNREDFHNNPGDYICKFIDYVEHTDVLMNGIYWDTNVPRLFEMENINDAGFRIQTIADITDDKGGSVPCNLGDTTIEDPVYGVDKETENKTLPYLPGSIDIMAVGNLPNELPRDASRYFGEQLIKNVIKDLLGDGSSMIRNATILDKGMLTKRFHYLEDYANSPVKQAE